MLTKNLVLHGLSTVALSAMVLWFLNAHVDSALALALTTLSDTQSSLKINNASDHTIQFVTQTGVAPGDAISITFPIEYVMGSFSIANVDLGVSSSASCSSVNNESLDTLPLGSVWGVSQTGQVITFTSGTASIPANRCIQVRIGSNATFEGGGVSQINNPSVPGNYAINIGGSFGDTGYITENVITNDTIAVSGTVGQVLAFSVSTSTLYFGTLDPSTTKFASSTNASGDTAETVAHTLDVSTNAASGFTLTVHGQTLTSQQNPANTISPVGSSAASSSPGTEQFGLRVTESGGIGITVSPTYGAASSYGYDGMSTSVIASGSGSTLSSTYFMYYIANIAPVTEAGTYATNLVYITTANF